MSTKKRKPRKDPLKQEQILDHRDKMTMRAHQRAAFKRNAALAATLESTPPRDEESAPPMFDAEWCPCQGLTAECALCGG